ncbi:MAG TPA: hypothetical protein IAA36_04440 [Candidatus Eubacterium pullicola]|nr:hypothetical protein [Candidatus Eubacterium pullicola]
MFYIIGVFRRTALWAMLLTILGSISMGDPGILSLLVIFGVAYLLFVLIHLLACKIGKSRRSAGEAYVSALGADLAAPFSKIGTFIAVITKKWIIRDNSKFHNFVDGLQVVTGGIWAIIVWGIAIFFVVNMI